MIKRIFADTLIKNKNMFILLGCVGGMFSAVFELYRLESEPLYYALIISAVLCAALFTIDFIIETVKAKKLSAGLSNVADDPEALHTGNSFAAAQYRMCIIGLIDRMREMNSDFNKKRRDLLDYYTLWVHQIKTPIAILKMKIGVDDVSLSGPLLDTERYVDMALAYLRLDGDGTDLVIREYALDPIIRSSVKKFAPVFIEKKTGLKFDGTDETAVTDAKWLSLILEQLISNALKYTASGYVRIKAENGTITVSDTGVGIAAADMPRIFERGYTGINGRTDTKSTGLGLYLCKKAATLISAVISAESTEGEGSTFTLTFPEKF